MRRQPLASSLGLLLAALLAAGCAAGANPEPPAGSDPAVPSEGEVCLKPENPSGIKFSLHKPESDSSHEAEAGWTVARPAFQLIGQVHFPAEVDPSSVQIHLDAQGWQAAEVPAHIHRQPNTVLFHFLSVGAEPEPLAWGEPGWLTITVEGAKTPDGQPLQSEPAALRIFAYNREMQEAYPYLLECYESLESPPRNDL